MSDSKDKPTEKITVAGVTFSADEVKSAVLKIDNREVVINEQKRPEKKIGFDGG